MTDRQGGKGRGAEVLRPDPLDTLKPAPHKGLGLNVSINGMGGGVLPVGLSVPGYQYSLPFNRIEMDSALQLAPNGQGLAKEWQCKNAESLENALLENLREYLGVQRFRRDRYKAGLTMLMANLLQAYRLDAGLILPRHTWHKADDPRNPASISPRITNTWVDYLAELGLITLHVGRSNEYQGAASWAVADPQLIYQYEKARIVLHDKTQLVEIRGDAGTVLAHPKNRNKQARIKVLTKPVESYNRTWLKHQASLQGRYLIPWARRIFNHGRLDLGGRFYAPYQALPKADRAKIRIDGQVTVEHDYSALHFNLLYALEGLQFVGDPYALPGVDRGTSKQCGLRLLNSENLPGFKATVTRSGNKKIQQIHADYTARRENFERLRAVGLHAIEPTKPDCLEGIIDGVKPGTTGEGILQAYQERHQAVAHWFGVENIGLQLQFLDSEIMAAALLRLAGVPVLVIHDSIRCRRDDSKRVLDAMRDAYKEITGGFDIRIDSKAH